MRLLALLLAAALLAGCTDPASTDLDPQDTEPVPDPTSGDGGGANGTAPPGPPAPNTPPTASLTADDADGTAPLNVTFTLDGSDEDGDALTWTLDRDGDGTIDDQGDSLPATRTYAYEAGEWTARLTVFDGEDEAEATQAVEVFEVEEPPAGPVQQLSVSWQVGASDVGAVQEAILACEAGPLDGVTHATFQADEATAGLLFTATLAVDTGAEAVQGWSLAFFSADCSIFDLFEAEGAASIQGTVPEGMPFVVATATGGVGLTAAYAAG